MDHIMCNQKEENLQGFWIPQPGFKQRISAIKGFISWAFLVRFICTKSSEVKICLKILS